MNAVQRYFNKRQWRFAELPDQLIIETVLGCNLRCGMCPVPEWKSLMDGRSPVQMSLETFKALLAGIADKPRNLHLNQLGEPLLNRHLAEFVKLAKEQGHFVSFTTNGTLMDEEAARKLLAASVDHVIFSVDGFHPATYEGIRIGADYERVRGNVERFYNLKRELHPETVVQIDCIVSELTKGEIPLMQEYWQDKVDCFNTIPLDDWAGKHELPRRFGLRNWVSRQTGSGRYPCDLLWTTMSVSAEGRGMYCCHDYRLESNLPNVTEVPLPEIWRSFISKEREKHVKGRIDNAPCSTCEAWKTRPPCFESESRARAVADLLLRRLGRLFNRATEGFSC